MDKMLALTGRMPSIQITSVVPTEAERDERDRAHQAVDAIVAKVRAAIPGEGG